MRILLPVFFLLALAVAGCAGKKAADQQSTPQPYTGAPVATGTTAATNQALVVAPETALVGKVALVNAAGRYVVLNFPLGKMAAAEQHLNLYRGGLKVGEVKVSGPQRGENIVADLVAGEAEMGDEARSQ